MRVGIVKLIIIICWVLTMYRALYMWSLIDPPFKGNSISRVQRREVVSRESECERTDFNWIDLLFPLKHAASLRYIENIGVLWKKEWGKDYYYSLWMNILFLIYIHICVYIRTYTRIYLYITLIMLSISISPKQEFW